MMQTLARTATPEGVLSTVNRDRAALALVLFFGIPWAAITFVFALSGGNSTKAEFWMWAGCFALALLCFLELHGLQDRGWCSATVLLTLRAGVEFLIVPVWMVSTGQESADGLYAKAMLFALLGFCGFWLGSWAVHARRKIRFTARWAETPQRAVFAALLLICVGVVGKTVLWKLGLSSYLSDDTTRTAALPFLQWLALAAGCLQAGLLVCSIEFLGKRSTNPWIRILFWISFAFTLLFGVISGMKSEILEPILIVMLALAIVRGRFPKSLLVLPVLLVLLYPFVNSYRTNLNAGYRQQANTVDGLTAVLEKSVSDVFFTSPTEGSALNQGVEYSGQRLSLLSNFRDILGLPVPSALNGDERLWMAPIYPFIPRFLWKDKPIINKGQRLTMLLTGGRDSSTALTPVGDLYTLGGLKAILVGMLLYGIILQLLMNWFTGEFSEKGVFVFLWALLPLINLESDVFGLITSSIDAFIVALLFASFVYGGGFFTFAAKRERR